MELQSLNDQWEGMGDMGMAERHNAPQAGGDEESGWTDKWVVRVLFAPHRVRVSYQEEKALRHFDQFQREGRR